MVLSSCKSQEERYAVLIFWDADALFVRSVTKVDHSLLAGTSITFVGTATSGVDHVDRGYLNRQGIDFTSAPGANANAVSDYVLSAIACYGKARNCAFNKLVFGVIGAGKVGGLLCRRLVQQGVDSKQIKVYDPFIDCVKGLPALQMSSFEHVLESDVITLHTPLIECGDAPTLNLLTEVHLQGLSEHALLINASRGGVINEEDLLKTLQPASGFVLCSGCLV